MAVCKIAQLKVQKNSTVYSFNMMDYGDVISAGFNQMLCVQYNGKTWYVPSYPVTSVLNYKKNGVNYGCVYVTPEITVGYTKSSSSVQTSSGIITTYYIKLTSASVNIAVNTSFDIYFSSNDGASYVKAGTLSAGSLSITLDTELSSMSSTSFRIQIRTSIGFGVRTGSVLWREWAYPQALMTATIRADVTISDTFERGWIFYRGEFNSSFPPWHTYGDSTVLEAGRTSGNTERGFGTSEVGALEWHTILFYEPNTEGAGTTKLCERGFVAVPHAALATTNPDIGHALSFSDGFSFEAVAGAPQTLATGTPPMDNPSGVGFYTYTIPSTWW